jgi:hypothetical protein
LGGVAINNVVSNDSINGALAVIGTNATISAVSFPSGISLNTTTGAISVTPGTPAGAYPVTYSLCDLATPANCVDQIDTVFVTPSIDPDYESGTVTSALGGVAINNVVSNDSINGVSAVIGTNATISAVSFPSGISLNTTTGAISVTPGTPAGAYPVTYSLCDLATPANCVDQIDTVFVIGTTLDVNITYVNVPVTGKLNTNDDVLPGTTYGSPAPNTSNPSTELPTINPNGSYTFTTSVPGVYVFLVPVCPVGVIVPNCPEEKLIITVLDDASATNAPVAHVDLGTTIGTVPVTLNTLSNDAAGSSQNNLNPASVVVTTDPKHGTITVNPTTGATTYTANQGFVGIDTLTYNVCDNQTPPVCTKSQQIITVLPIGISNTTGATDDYVSVPSGTTATGNALANDIDAEKNQQTIQPYTVTTTEGTFTINDFGAYTFVPTLGFTGPVEYIYTLCDNGSPQACEKATVHILVAPSTAFPIELSEFSAAEKDCKAVLNWVTQSEVNGKLFEIQVSKNGSEWKTVGNVAAIGNSTAPQRYSYVYQNPEGLNYYRLKMVDNDGHTEFSSMVSVFSSCGKASINVYPNPTSVGTAVDITYSLDYSTTNEGQIIVTDIYGRIIKASNVRIESGRNTVKMGLEDFAAGVYFIRLETSQKDSEVVKLVVVH